MLTGAKYIEYKELRREWESAELMSQQFPKNMEFRKLADALYLLIHNKEVNNRYI
jgi:hypothetical protein